jgi:hypothetical protein
LVYYCTSPSNTERKGAWWVRVIFGLCIFSVCAGVPKLGQRGEVQDLMAKAFVGSNPTPCTTSQKFLKMLRQGNGSVKQSVRVKNWEEFRKLTLEKKPKSIVTLSRRALLRAILQVFNLSCMLKMSNTSSPTSQKAISFDRPAYLYTATQKATGSSKTATYRAS